MKTILYDIQRLFLRSTFCLLMLTMAVPVLAQDDETDASSDDETEDVRRPVRKSTTEKYELTTVRGKVYDLATKQALAGVQVKMLGNSRYAALRQQTGNVIRFARTGTEKRIVCRFKWPPCD